MKLTFKIYVLFNGNGYPLNLSNYSPALETLILSVVFLMISDMFDLGLLYFRGRAIVPETAILQSPERL